MSWFADARALAYLRRLIVAQDRIAISLEQIAQVMQDDWNTRNVQQQVKKPTTFGTFDIDEANRIYEEQQAILRGER